MREGESGRVEPFFVDREPNEDARYLSMLFSDLGDFPPIERPPVESLRQNGDQRAEPEPQPVLDGPLVVNPQPVRPFIDEVLNGENGEPAPSAPTPRKRRWQVAALSFVAFMALGGIAAAVLSLGYQWNARTQESIRTNAASRAAVPQQSGLAPAVGTDAPLTGFQGCATGDGLSPTALLLVAKDFVPTAGPPAVCLPAEQPRKRKASSDAMADEASISANPAAAVVATAPANNPTGSKGRSERSSGGTSGGSSGGSTQPGGDTGTGGGDTGTGTDPSTGGGDTGTGTDPSTGGGDTGAGTDPDTGGETPDDGTSTHPKEHGNGWGKGGRPPEL